MQTGEDVRAAITTIHDALGDGDISTSDAAELLRVAQLTLRLLREVDTEAREVEERLDRVEEAVTKCLNLLGAAPDPGAKSDAPLTAPETADPAGEEGAIVNNNAETMHGTAAEPAVTAVAPAEPPPAAKNSEDSLVAAALDNAVEAVCPRRRESVKQQLMNSVSPAALLPGEVAVKTTRVALPHVPLASAA